MHVAKVDLSNYRNYEQLSLTLSPGKTLISGDNGQGKTNLIEALFYISHQSSHRPSKTNDLLKHGADAASISAQVVAKNRQLLPAVEIRRSEANKFFINGTKVTKSSAVSGVLRTVMFSPEDISLVRGEPTTRRSFIDQVLVQISPKLAQLKSNYDRVLKQRNALLKSARTNGFGDASTLEIWDEQLVEFGSQLIAERISLIETLLPKLQVLYEAISNQADSVDLEIQSTIWGWSEDEDSEDVSQNLTTENLKDQFASLLQGSRKLEVERGITLFGPHRDDIKISLNRHPAKTQASQGEAWSLALGLKLAVAQLYRGLDSTGDPVLLLDDVFSVLDNGRRSRLMSFVDDFEQVLVTSTSNSVDGITNWAQTITVEGGRAVVNG